MPGKHATYTAANCDFITVYAKPTEWCRMRGWLPTTMSTDMNVLLVIPGGGWNDAQHLIFDDVHRPYTSELGGGTGSLYDALLDAGWVVVYLEFPPGLNITSRSRFHPVSRYPIIPRSIGGAVQFLKTHALDGLITGSRSYTLGTDYRNYAIECSSSGAVESLFVAMQPDKALPYSDRFIQHAGDDPLHYKFNHRVRAVINGGGACDFTKFDSGSISAAALPRFGARERFYVNPAFGGITREAKSDASTLPLAAANYAENKHVGIMQVFSLDAASVAGISRCPGSYLGSGTKIGYSATPTGTFAVGETISDGTTSGVLKYKTSTLMYVERTSGATQFAGTVTGATSGAHVAIDSASGNPSRLAFLSDTAALAIVDAAGTGEIADLADPHDPIFAAMLQRALDQNDAINSNDPEWVGSMHRNYIGNVYTASISDVDDASIADAGLDYALIVTDWLRDVMGMEV